MKAPWNITGLNTHSLQGDAQFVKIIEAFQTHTSQELILDMGSMPDTSMTAMIIAAFENFNTVITNVSTLKDKECNRLQAMHDELKKVGIKTEIAEDWNAITIHGNPHISLTHPIEIETHHDHRIAMCFAIL